MKIKLLSLELENFKGTKNAKYEFADETNIYGANASGKTTIFDALWWLLFNKDSTGSEKFSIRPLDKDGNMIDNVDIRVTGIFDIDGKEVELNKVQKQKWTKKRGTDTSEFTGNINTFEIDGYPKSESEYKKYISDLIGEDIFKLLTNPMYFTSLKWKEQRNIIMQFITGKSDIELAEMLGGYDELIPELEKAPNIEDIQKKYTKAMNELKKRLEEYPVRVDELSKKLSTLEQNIAEKNKHLNSIDRTPVDIIGITKERDRITVKMAEIKSKANAELSLKKIEIKGLMTGYNKELSNLHKSIAEAEKMLETYNKDSKDFAKELETYREMYRHTQKFEFDDKTLICPYCEQEYTEIKKDALKAEFYSKKEKELNSIKTKGNNFKEHLDVVKCNKETTEEELKALHKKASDLDKALDNIVKDFMLLPDTVDLSDNKEYTELKAELAKLDKINYVDNSAEISKLETEIEVMNGDLKTTEVRISALTNEQRNTAQKIIECEKMIYLLEQFIKGKMDKVSNEINGNFNMVNFILFKTQINGGLAETCECEYNGVPYSSLNAAAKIQCGLDIICSLQKLLDVYAPVFIDNRESCTNIPEMSCQVVNMYVSAGDKKIRVEAKND